MHEATFIAIISHIAEAKSSNLDFCKSLNKVNFLVDDVFNLSFDDNYFDGIISSFLIVNFSDEEIKTSLNEIKRVLKHDGILLISFHIGENEDLTFDDFFEKDNKITFKLHSIEKIHSLLNNAGYKISETVIKYPYEGEITKRAFIYCINNKL